jgi:hypothetical protein
MGFWDTLNTVGNSLGTNGSSGYEKWSTNVISDGRRSYTGYLLQPLDVSASILFANVGTRGLNIRGKSIQSDENDKLYPAGFTPELDFYINPENINSKTGYPVERGAVLGAGVIKGNTTLAGTPKNINDYLNPSDGSVVKAYKALDNLSEYKFKHDLDPDKIDINAGNIYLTTYKSTNFNNEDPVNFGYDIIINYANSPLFNGGIENFIDKFSSYSEVKTRKDVISQFKSQFFKFFKIDASTSVKDYKGNSVMEPDEFGGKYVPRTYYLKKLSGLDNLTESINSDKPKQFIDYGNDYLTLTLNEDVTVNMGYLASLYKILSWSRINGKKMFPDNLLRFDMQIVVTESRKYNKVNKNNKSTQASIDNYADVISRYRYNIYECQFFFEKMSHDDSIDMSALDISQGFDIKINYKYATVNFEWLNNYDFNNNTVSQNNEDGRSFLDNSEVDLTTINPGNANNFAIDSNGSILTSPFDYPLNKYGMPYTIDPVVQKNFVAGSVLNDANNSVKVKDNYAARLKNYFPPESNNNSVALRDQLIQQTIDNISNQFGSIGSMIFNSAVSGFTEDGYEYNIPAYYLNKTLNAANNTLYAALGLSKQVNTGNYTQGKDSTGAWQYDLKDWEQNHRTLR